MFANRVRNKRQPRILAIQKEALVNFLKNYFIRCVGRCSNVNGVNVDMKTWQSITEKLNTLGPSKTAVQWNTSLSYMKTRIRSKMKIIKECKADPRDNLAEIDLKIYEMFPDISVSLMPDEPDIDVNEVNRSFISEDQQFRNNEANNGSENEGVCTVVVNSAEELDALMNEPPIISDMLTDNSSDEVDYVCVASTRGLSNIPKNKTIGKLATQTSNKATTPDESVKTSRKIPEIQKERLVQLIQNNFLKTVGRFSGCNGVFQKKRLWENFAVELNTLGPPRTAQQWKTTADNIKSTAKAKLADDHNNDFVSNPLNSLEEKMLSMYGLNNLDGEQNLGEGGFQYKKTVPAAKKMRISKKSRNDIANSTNGQEYNTPIRGSSRDLDLNRSKDAQNCNSTITSGAYMASRSQHVNDQDSSIHELSQNEDSQDLRYNDYDANDDNGNSPVLIGQNSHNEFNEDEQEFTGQADQGQGEQERPYRISEDEILREILNEIRSEPNENANSNISGSSAQSGNSTGHTTQKNISSSIPSRIPSNERSTTQNTGQSGVRRPIGSGISSNERDTTHHEIGQSDVPRPTSRDLSTGLGRNSRGRNSRGRNSRGRNSRGLNSRGRISRGRNSRRRTSRGSSSPDMNWASVNRFFDDHGTDEDNDMRRSRYGNTSDDDDDTVTNGRDRSRYRNKHTSYDQVERSMRAQERFIEENAEGHSQIIYSLNRGNSETFAMFTHAVNTCADVLRDIFQRN